MTDKYRRKVLLNKTHQGTNQDDSSKYDLRIYGEAGRDRHRSKNVLRSLRTF